MFRDLKAKKEKVKGKKINERRKIENILHHQTRNRNRVQKTSIRQAVHDFELLAICQNRILPYISHNIVLHRISKNIQKGGRF
jgi:hypothetical protein